MDRNKALEQIMQNDHAGWTTLVNIVFDNKPEHIEITEVFQKWAGLEVRYEGEDKHFEELCETVNHISQFMCELCGKSGGYTIIDGWETTLCDEHFDRSDAREKYRNDPGNKSKKD